MGFGIHGLDISSANRQYSWLYICFNLVPYCQEPSLTLMEAGSLDSAARIRGFVAASGDLAFASETAEARFKAGHRRDRA
jgi:hypothetical protein